jgi:hypothetical protein
MDTDDNPRPEAESGSRSVAARAARQRDAEYSAAERSDRIADNWQLATHLWPALHALGYRSGTLGGRGADADILAGRPPHLRRYEPDAPNDLSDVHEVRREAFMSFIAQVPARFPHVDLTVRHQAQDLVEMPAHRGQLDVVLQGVPYKQWTCPPGSSRLFADHATDFLQAGLDLTRRGGISINLVHQQFLDHPDPDLRQQLTRRADLIGALRLPPRHDPDRPDGYGPIPPVDVVLLRRRPKGAHRSGPAFTDLAPITVNGRAATINEYYARHPGNVLGDLVPGYKGHINMLAPTVDREGLGWQIHHALGRIVSSALQHGLTAPGFLRPPQPPEYPASGLGL